MLQKFEINSEMALYCYVDENKNKRYAVEKILSVGEYEIDAIDGPIKLSTIPPGVKLIVSTAFDVVVMGNVEGKLTVRGYQAPTFTVLIKGNILSSGVIHTHDEKKTIVEGSVAGKLMTSGVTLIEEKILTGAEVFAKNKLTINGTLEQGSKVSSRRLPTLFNQEVNLTQKKASVSSKTFLGTKKNSQREIDDNNSLQNPIEKKKWNYVGEKKRQYVLQEMSPSLQKKSFPNKRRKTNDKERMPNLSRHNVESESLDDLNDKELNEYILKDHEIVNEKVSLRFENRRSKIIASVADFVSKIEQDGMIKSANLFLKKHQIEAVEGLQRMVESGVTKGYLDCPTGSGKTILMILFYLAMGKPPTLILESRSILIDQTIEEFKKYIPDCDIGIFDGLHKKIGGNLTVSTYQSIQTQYDKIVGERALKPGRFMLVFCDEGHNALGKGRHSPIEEFFTSAFVIGCSATPAFNSQRDSGALNSMSQLFGYLIYSYSLPQAINDRVLVPCQNIHAYVDADLHFNFDQFGRSPGGNEQDDYDIRELNRVLNQKKINQIPVMLYANGFCERTGRRLLGQTAIVFAMGIDNAKKIAAEFNNSLSDHPYFKFYGGEVAVALYGTLGKRIKNDILKRHMDGRLKVIVCDKLCMEGFNNPKTSVIINAKPTRSILALQRGGRATRVLADDPDKVATIIDIIYKELGNQLTFDQFLGNNFICGEQFIRDSSLSSYGGEWDPIDNVNAEQVIILNDTFKLINPPSSQHELQPLENEAYEELFYTRQYPSITMNNRVNPSPWHPAYFNNPSIAPADVFGLNPEHLEGLEFKPWEPRL